MAIDTVLILYWLYQRDSSNNRMLLGVMTLILVADVVFCFGNLQKIIDGGWIPALMAGSLFLVMNTWTRGRVVLARQIALERHSVNDLRQRLASNPPARTSGTAVFLASNPNGLPRALWHNVEFNNVLHEQVILLTILTEEIPRVPDHRRIEVSEVIPGMTRVVARFGFMESPVVNDILCQASRQGVNYKLANSVFFGRLCWKIASSDHLFTPCIGSDSAFAVRMQSLS